jgi:FlaG/FlaF family flagellin (archaellin)
VILLVAIVVILAAVIGVLVLDIGNNLDESSSAGVFRFKMEKLSWLV